MTYNLITILGPTASGKTKLAVQLAAQLQGEIISGDSRQVYRGMDIGTGKDLNEYQVNNQRIPYHLIDIVEAGDSYHIHKFQEDFQLAFDDIRQRNKLPILCGGSGMYLEAVLKGYQLTSIPIDEANRAILESKTTVELRAIFDALQTPYTAQADTSTRKRLLRAIEINRFLMENPNHEIPNKAVPNALIFGLNPELEVRRERITKRLHERLQNGMIEEVKTLLDAGTPAEKLIFYGLEYKFLTQYLQGELSYDVMVERLNIAIHQFAKRQMTYFRKMEKDGLEIHWLNSELPFDKLFEEIMDKLNNQ